MSNVSTSDMLERAITEAIRRAVEEQVNNSIEDAKRKLDDAVPSIVAAVSLRVFGMIKMETFQRELVIRVELKKDETV